MMTRTIGTLGYHAEIDNITSDEWTDCLQLFDDATIYQTWAYGVSRWGHNNVKHIVLKKDGRTVAATQMRLISVPFSQCGIAYVGWGPLWKFHDQRDGFDHLSHMLRVLRKEFVVRRRMYLRIFPYIFGEDPTAETLREVFASQGYHWHRYSMRTLILDLSPPLLELRRNTRRKWRQVLGYSERENLTFVAGTDEGLLETAIEIYKQMQKRKKFAEFADSSKLLSIQKRLPDAVKNQILICYVEGVPAAALVWSVVGRTGLPLLAATGLIGRKKNASYLLWWKMIEWLKAHGYGSLDLGGLNPERNPGSYVFKSGIGGKTGHEVNYLGYFDACESRSSLLLFQAGNRIRQLYRAAQLTLEKRRRSSNSGKLPAK